jgi:5-methyltetrahydrofolate--homocysteine methyltransferase
MHDLISRLVAGAPVVTDGAWGTQLQVRGLPIGECPERWNLEHPDRVEDVARAYVEAGSRIILTNTFGGNRVMLERHGLAGQTAEINCTGAALSKRAAGVRALVFASIGPTGKMPMMGDVTEEELLEVFGEQARALRDGGADGLVIETMADPQEAAAAVKAAKATGLPVVGCMVYDSGADLDRTMMGITPEQAAEVLAEAGADVIGANCGKGILPYIPICRRLRAATAKPLWLKPNAGLPVMVDGKAVYRQRPEEFAEAIREIVRAGAAFVGGCCGTSPDFIKALDRVRGC